MPVRSEEDVVFTAPLSPSRPRAQSFFVSTARARPCVELSGEPEPRPSVSSRGDLRYSSSLSMRIALLYPPPWKIAERGEPPLGPPDGPPSDYREGDLDADFYQTPYGLL